MVDVDSIGENLVIVAEDRCRSRYLSEIIMDLANSMGAEAVLPGRTD